MGVAIVRHVHDDGGGVTAQRVLANDSLRRLFRAPTMDELVSRPVLESSIDIKALERVNRALAAKTPLSGFETERIRPDGFRFWVSMTGQPIVLHGEELTIVWDLDITCRIKAEENAQSSEPKLRGYMASSID